MANYLLNEKDSNISFAVLKDVSKNDELVHKAEQAVKEEYCYEDVFHTAYIDKQVENKIFLTFKCKEDGATYIRDFELKETTIY